MTRTVSPRVIYTWKMRGNRYRTASLIKHQRWRSVPKLRSTGNMNIFSLVPSLASVTCQGLNVLTLILLCQVPLDILQIILIISAYRASRIAIGRILASRRIRLSRAASHECRGDSAAFSGICPVPIQRMISRRLTRAAVIISSRFASARRRDREGRRRWYRAGSFVTS